MADAEVKPNLLVGDGDSYIAGNGASGPAHYLGQQVLDLLGGDFGTAYVNNGIGGTTTLQVLTRAQTMTFPMASADKYGKMIDIFYEGENDIYYGATPEQAFEHTMAYCKSSKAAGFHVIVSTFLSRSAVPTPADYNTNRAAYNALLLKQTECDGVADWASDPRMGCDGCEKDTTYFSGDNIHPNDYGYAIGASYYAMVIDELGLR